MDVEKLRANERHAVSIDVLVDAEGTPLSARVTDMSSKGIGVQSLKNLQPGIHVSVAFQIPEEVVLFGVLMWSQHTTLNQLDAYNMGFDIHAIRHQGMLHDEPSENKALMQDILARIKEHQASEAAGD
ncbi:MAG: PilZ domain-containing protein [Desulfobacterales bacterium]